MAQSRSSVASLAASSGPPHSVSLKVLRLSRPSFAPSTVLPSDPSTATTATDPLLKASLPYPSAPTTPFPLSPLLQLPPSFGAAYVGTTFACTLCANNELAGPRAVDTAIRDVVVSAELQTPNGGVPLDLHGAEKVDGEDAVAGGEDGREAEDMTRVLAPSLTPGATLQRIVRHDLRDDGPHVLAVTVSYTEVSTGDGSIDENTPATESATPQQQPREHKRTFRKLYQFVAQPAVGVRTKIGHLTPVSTTVGGAGATPHEKKTNRAFVLEAQLENLTEGTVVLERVGLILAKGLRCRSLNWDVDDEDEGSQGDAGRSGSMSIIPTRPQLAPSDVEQVAFSITQLDGEMLEEKMGRVVLAQVVIDWRGPMGERGELTTGWLVSRTRG